MEGGKSFPYFFPLAISEHGETVGKNTRKAEIMEDMDRLKGEI